MTSTRDAIPQEAHEIAHALLTAASNIVGGVTSDEVFGRGRRPNVMLVRQAVVLTLRRKGWSLAEIGIALQRDHSTIHYNFRQGERLLTSDASLARLVADLEAGVTEPVSLAARLDAMEQRIADLEAMLAPRQRVVA